MKTELNDIAAIAERFVTLITNERYRPWPKVTELPADELQILMDAVAAAGFEINAVVPGVIEDTVQGQGGSTGEKFTINRQFPFKTICGNSKYQIITTGWLNEVASCIITSHVQKGGRELHVELVTKAIEESIPLKPIQITVMGDFLKECPPQYGGSVLSGQGFCPTHTRDTTELPLSRGSQIGIHAYCGYPMERFGATATDDVIVCKGCYLRVYFGKQTKTYGGLRSSVRLSV